MDRLNAAENQHEQNHNRKQKQKHFIAHFRDHKLLGLTERK